MTIWLKILKDWIELEGLTSYSVTLSHHGAASSHWVEEESVLGRD